ncbi:MAG: IS30 family transposase [Candidatus Paceibacterota bacterium]|jgi:IS30 family transposase
MKYKQLSIEEREKIQEMLWQKASARTIAKALNRNPSSISREISKNKSLERNIYTSRLAHAKALAYRKHRGREDRLKNEDLRKHVVAKLKLGWSPEQIAGTAEEAAGTSISHEAIYQYVYAQIHRDGYGYARPGKEDLRPYLAWRRKRRMKKGLRKSYRIEKGLLPSIDDRPEEIVLRAKIGHWEDDCIISYSSSDRLKTINERVSGIVFISKIKDGTMKETNRAVSQRLGAVPKRFRKTLTRDRGSENLGHEELELTLGIRCFFAHAYHPWERGSNENLNGLIRRFLPKKTDFRTVTEEEITRIEYLLNSRPRKRLGWKTPYEVFYKLTGVALQC